MESLILGNPNGNKSTRSCGNDKSMLLENDLSKLVIELKL